MLQKEPMLYIQVYAKKVSMLLPAHPWGSIQCDPIRWREQCSLKCILIKVLLLSFIALIFNNYISLELCNFQNLLSPQFVWALSVVNQGPMLRFLKCCRQNIGLNVDLWLKLRLSMQKMDQNIGCQEKSNFFAENWWKFDVKRDPYSDPGTTMY
jgi:hypothetical protein